MQRHKRQVKQAQLAGDTLQALELRRDGMDYRSIGRTLGMSHEKARMLVMDEIGKLEGLAKNEAQEMRRIQLERLNTYRLALMGKSQDEAVVRALLKVDEHEAKLLGLYAPEKHEVKSENVLLSFSVTDEQRQQIADSLLKKC